MKKIGIKGTGSPSREMVEAGLQHMEKVIKTVYKLRRASKNYYLQALRPLWLSDLVAE